MRVSSSAPAGSGSAIASIAARRDVFEQIVVADVDPARAATEPRQRPARRSVCRPPASMPPTRPTSSSWPARRAPTSIVNACDPRFNPPIFDAAFEAGCHYLDMAMHMSMPHPTDPYNQCGVKLGDAQFAVARPVGRTRPAGARGHGCRARVLRRRRPLRRRPPVLPHRRDRRARRRDLVIDGFAFAPTFSIWTTIEECLNPPIIYERDRGWFTTEPFSEPETFDVPRGHRPARAASTSSTRRCILMPRWIDVGRVTFKYGLGDEFIDVLATLHKLGLDSTKPVTVRGRRGVAARRRRRRAAQPGRTRRPHARPHVRRVAGHRPRPRRPAARAPTCTRSSTTSGRCASTAIKPSCGRRRCTRWSPSRCWPTGEWKGPGVQGPGGVPRRPVPRPARRARRSLERARIAARPRRQPAGQGSGRWVADDRLPASTMPAIEAGFRRQKAVAVGPQQLHHFERCAAAPRNGGREHSPRVQWYRRGRTRSAGRCRTAQQFDAERDLACRRAAFGDQIEQPAGRNGLQSEHDDLGEAEGLGEPDRVHVAGARRIDVGPRRPPVRSPSRGSRSSTRSSRREGCGNRQGRRPGRAAARCALRGPSPATERARGLISHIDRRSPADVFFDDSNDHKMAWDRT